MIEWDVITDFARVFDGRHDAYGDDAGFCVHEPVTIMHYRQHLEGHKPIGIYNVARHTVIGYEEYLEGTDLLYREHTSSFPAVKWGAIDIDYDDLQEAWNVHDLLKSVGVNSWVERSRSKGYHAWVFVEDWISAKTMRRALLVVRDFLKLKAREVYPKQEILTEDKPYGNWLRLPYPGALASGFPAASQGELRRVMLYSGPGRGQMLHLAVWLSSADLYADPQKLELLAQRWQEPRRIEVPHFDAEGEWGPKARVALHRLSVPLLWHIVKHGPTDGGDRSSTLMRIANMAAKNGADVKEAYAIVRYADSHHWGGKYVDRPEYYEDVIQRVYGTLDLDSTPVQ